VLRIILVTLAGLIAVPIIVGQAVGLYVSIGTARFDEAEQRVTQGKIERIANPLTRERAAPDGDDRVKQLLAAASARRSTSYFISVRPRPYHRR
jgi:hypothetical protein